jgi:hypothetical protein
MMERLNGSPESNNDGVRTMSRRNDVTLSSTRLVNGAIKTVPTISVLKQVRAKRRTLSQGNLSGRAASIGNSAGRVNVLSMKQLLLLLQRLQILAGLEAYGFSWRDVDFGSGPWVTSDTGLARFYRKNSEAAQLNPIVGFKCILHAVEDRIDRLLRFGLANTRPLDDLVYKIEFDHWRLRLTIVCLLSLLQPYSYHPYGELRNVN